MKNLHSVQQSPRPSLGPEIFASRFVAGEVRVQGEQDRVEFFYPREATELTANDLRHVRDFMYQTQPYQRDYGRNYFYTAQANHVLAELTRAAYELRSVRPRDLDRVRFSISREEYQLLRTEMSPNQYRTHFNGPEGARLRFHDIPVVIE